MAIHRDSIRGPVDANGEEDGTPALLGRAANGDGAAWTDLLDQATSRLRVLLHFRKNADASAAQDDDDLIQETFAEAARSLDRFEYRGPGSLQRWLAGILRNKMRDAARTGRRVPMPVSALPGFASDSPSTSPRGLLEALVASSSRPSAGLRRVEAERKVSDVLAALPEPLRETMLLRVYEGLTAAETAERLGVDASTISVRTKQALDACARRLEDLRP